MAFLHSPSFDHLANRDLYSGVTDKASAFIGPLIVGAITAGTGSVRNGFWYVLGLLIVALALVPFIDQKGGREEAFNFKMVQSKVDMEQAGEVKETGLGKSDTAVTV